MEAGSLCWPETHNFIPFCHYSSETELPHTAPVREELHAEGWDCRDGVMWHTRKPWGRSFKMSYLSLFQAQQSHQLPSAQNTRGFHLHTTLSSHTQPVGLEVLQHSSFCSQLHSTFPCAGSGAISMAGLAVCRSEGVSGWDSQGCSGFN